MKYYLGVGINKYPGCPLNGCVNDVYDLFTYLHMNCGFIKGDNMRMILDERAKKYDIINRLEWLSGIAKEGDLCIFQYSGHGAQVPERLIGGEVDGMDEVLCPQDFDWDGMYITDELLGRYADLISSRGAVPVFVMDCCHSGTMLRDSWNPFKPKKTNRSIPMPIDISARMPKRCLNRQMKSEINENAILISGCTDCQTSADAKIKGRFNGAMTYYLIKYLIENPSATYRELKDDLQWELKKGGYEQTPQVSGGERLLDRSVFF